MLPLILPIDSSNITAWYQYNLLLQGILENQGHISQVTKKKTRAQNTVLEISRIWREKSCWTNISFFLKSFGRSVWIDLCDSPEDNQSPVDQVPLILVILNTGQTNTISTHIVESRRGYNPVCNSKIHVPADYRQGKGA